MKIQNTHIHVGDAITMPIYSAIKTVNDAHSDAKNTNKTTKKSGFQTLVKYT